MINITILLCQDYDENEMSIHKIFDNIEVENGRASFCITTIINAIEYKKEKFSLHFFLANLEEQKRAYIGEEAFEQSEENEASGIKTKIEASTQVISSFNLKNIEFISDGAHEILVYLYEDEDVDEAAEKVKDKKIFDLEKKEKLVATYGFNVNCKKKK